MNLESNLTQLERAELLRRLEQEDIAYIFKHALTQETAYQSLLLKRRRSIHRRVAETYETIYTDRVEEFASLLMHHYAEADEHVKVLHYAIADVCLRRSAHRLSQGIGCVHSLAER
jgi:predicted ATPase